MKSNTTKKIAAGLMAAVVLGVVPQALTYAATPAEIQAQIASLMQQLKSLRSQYAALQDQQDEVKTQQETAMSSLRQVLREGMSGDQVSALQALLAGEDDVYPGGKITGYFGSLTANAVKRFQKKHRIRASGVVDANTLAQLNAMLQQNPLAVVSPSGTTSTVTLCAIVPPGHFVARGWQRKNGVPVVPTCQSLPYGIQLKLGIIPSTSSVDTVAPVLSWIATNPTNATATVTWTTNEPASSRIVYGMSTTSLTSSTALDSALVLTHAQNITGLLPSTTYYYSIQSKDAAGNLATSSVQSFTTLAAADVTAPVISNVVATSTATSTTVTWATNEPATSQVGYGATSTLGSLTALDSSLVTSHSQTFSGLNASTTYYYSVQSKDATGNLATSTIAAFTTTAQ